MLAEQERHASLIYIDMDGLKSLNDTHGHEVGSMAATRSRRYTA